MPLIRRLPKRGFNNAAFHKNYAIVNLRDLSSFKEGTLVNEELLLENQFVRLQPPMLRDRAGQPDEHTRLGQRFGARENRKSRRQCNSSREGPAQGTEKRSCRGRR